LENLTDSPITNLRFDIADILPRSTAATPDDLRGDLNQELTAKLRQQAQPPAPGAPALGAKHAVSFSTSLRLPKQEGRYEVDLVYRWDQGSLHGENRLLIGPLEILSREERWARVWASGYGVGKDLALPIAVAVLTFLLSRWEKEREEARQEAESAREQARHEAETQRESLRKEAEKHTQQVRETWARMLIISHRDAKKYYLPLLSTLRRLLDRIEPQDKDKEREEDWKVQAFFYLMLFLRIMTRLRQENGGFYLKSRAGEDVLSGLWFLLQQDIIEAFTQQHFDTAVSSVRHDELYPDFKIKIQGYCFTDLQECGRRFLEWLDKDFPDYIPLLRLFYWVLRYEANMAYVYWYGRVEEPPPDIDRHRTELLKGNLAKKVQANKLEADFDNYQNESQRRYSQLKAKLQDTLG
jgi:hypothetical protein